MAASIPSLALGTLLFAAAAAAHAASPRAALPISVEAESSDFDYKNGVLVFSRVVITQGDARVEADRATATGLEFENSKWRLEGHVQIRAEGGSLSSDLATVSFAANEISVAEVAGTPASFVQQRGEQRAEGRANRITYDLATGRVRLGGDAWLSDGNNQITGSTLVYSVREERVVAEAGEQGGQPVRITINPKSIPAGPKADKGGGSEPAEKQQPGPTG
jgi:lipopolysaccharide transport protein LptA